MRPQHGHLQHLFLLRGILGHFLVTDGFSPDLVFLVELAYRAWAHVPLGELSVEQHSPLGETKVCSPLESLLRHQPAFLPGRERWMPTSRLGCRIREISRVLDEQGVHSRYTNSKNLGDGRQCHQGSCPLASSSWPVPEAMS